MLDDAVFDAKRLRAETQFLVETALAQWQSRLKTEQVALEDLVSEGRRLATELEYYSIRAPAAGVLVGWKGVTEGSFVGVGQILATVAPDDGVAIEAFVNPRDVGLVRVGQPVVMQVDTFPYTQWGVLRGRVEAISGDLVSPGDGRVGSGYAAETVFKVTVLPEKTWLGLSNGVRGELRNGMTVTARFVVARRSLLQLLYEDVGSWLSPSAGDRAP